MTIYAIIVTYNAMQNSWIERCLKSLAESTTPVTPSVVDNGSTDNTCLFVPNEFPEVIWLPQNKNLGFGQANNVGIKYALNHNADYILLLNQDATISTKSIEKMLPHCDSRTLISPLHLNGDGSHLDHEFKKCLLASHNSILDDLLVTGHLNSTYSGPIWESGCTIPAACWFFHINVIRIIGGFNPLFFHYSEDDNYFQRLHYHNILIKICPSAIMYHDRGEHGNMKAFQRHRNRRNLLKVATDINLSFFQCLLVWLRLLKDCYVSYLPEHLYIPGKYTCDMLWLVANVHKIMKSRRIEKKEGLNWL